MIIIVSGGFDPIHSGHIQMFRQANKLGTVWAIVNSDEWLIRKKGFNLMNYDQRESIIQSNQYVDKVIPAKDKDNTIVSNLEVIHKEKILFVFANGGDRIPTNTPEVSFCMKNEIPMIFNLGGNKVTSSSKIAQKFLEQACK